MNTTLKISKGTWVSKETQNDYVTEFAITTGVKGAKLLIAKTDANQKSDEEIKANAQLIVDAGNTANETGLLPSEIWAERKHFASLSIKLSDRIVDLENQKEGMLMALIQAQATMKYACDKNKAGDGSTNGTAMKLVDDIIKQVTEQEN